jgi:hypothetical protein
MSGFNGRLGDREHHSNGEIGARRSDVMLLVAEATYWVEAVPRSFCSTDRIASLDTTPPIEAVKENSHIM